MKSKIVLVLLMTVSGVGGISLLMTNNPVYRKQEPSYITYNGRTIEAVTRVDLSKMNSFKKGFSHKSNQRGNADLLPDNNTGTAGYVSGAGVAEFAGKDKSLSGATRYAYRQAQKNKSTSDVAGFSGNGALGLLAQRQTAEQNGDAVIAQAPSDLAVTTFDKGMPSDLYLAPNAGKGKPGGAHPGLNPDVPVGDGVWILLILAAGYILYRRKLSAKVQL